MAANKVQAIIYARRTSRHCSIDSPQAITQLFQLARAVPVPITLTRPGIRVIRFSAISIGVPQSRRKTPCR